MGAIVVDAMVDYSCVSDTVGAYLLLTLSVMLLSTSSMADERVSYPGDWRKWRDRRIAFLEYLVKAGARTKTS